MTFESITLSNYFLKLGESLRKKVNQHELKFKQMILDVEIAIILICGSSDVPSQRAFKAYSLPPKNIF